MQTATDFVIGPAASAVILIRIRTGSVIIWPGGREAAGQTGKPETASWMGMATASVTGMATVLAASAARAGETDSGEAGADSRDTESGEEKTKAGEADLGRLPRLFTR